MKTKHSAVTKATVTHRHPAMTHRPARTQRAYLRIESALPAVLREALAPLTAIVGGAS